MTQAIPTVSDPAPPNGSGVTVTLAPQELFPGGFDGSVPLVGYLVVAPAGMPIEELLPPPVQHGPAAHGGATLRVVEPRAAAEEPETRPRAATTTAVPAPVSAAAAPPEAAAAAWPAHAAGVTVDADRRIVTVDGRVLSLTYLEFELLAFLKRHPNRVYSRGQLVSSIWGYGPVGDERTVDVHIARLRRKLGARHRGHIVTVRRVGYKYCPTA